jgi:hypothetical protein
MPPEGDSGQRFPELSTCTELIVGNTVFVEKKMIIKAPCADIEITRSDLQELEII